MYFQALAADYDGTLATHGKVDAGTVEGLQRLKASGRRLIMVTGRELDDLAASFDRLDLFDLIVAENGALLYAPASQEEHLLAPPPEPRLVGRLQAAGIAPLSVGRCIIATWEPNETDVLQAIRDLGLELQIIFNKGAVMVLPANVNKASGLQAALERLDLSSHNVVAIGDAENDHAFLAMCGCAIAVANATPSLAEQADLVMNLPRGEGVVELIDRLCENDLADTLATRGRRIPLGKDLATGQPIWLSAQAGATLITGISGGGKSTIATALLENFIKEGWQFCVIDPEGDYAEFADAVVIGDEKQPPQTEALLDLLALHPDLSVVVNLLALEVAERPNFFAKLLPDLLRLRAEVGRPHWLVIDEAHHMLPGAWQPGVAALPQALPATVAITVHPRSLSPALLRMMDTVVAVGSSPRTVLDEFCAATDRPKVEVTEDRLERRQAYLWRKDHDVSLIAVDEPEERLRRHLRKYAKGELGEDKSFYFKGPQGSLNLRAQNLHLFVQIGFGVDDATWQHHLRAGDYSAWLRDAIKDEDLAAEIEAIEADADLDAATSRQRVKEVIDRRYTGPATQA